MALTEFALVLPVLMLLLLGMLDLGKAFNYWIDQTHLANEGARWAAVNKNPGGATMSLQQYIASRANTEELKVGGTASVPSPIGVCIRFWRDGTPIPKASVNVGDGVEVRVSSTYHWLPIVGNKISILSTTIVGSAVMRVEQKPVNYNEGVCS